MNVRTLPVCAALLLSATTMQGQACLGLASLETRPMNVTAGAVFTDGANGGDARFGIGTAKAFGGASAQITKVDGISGTAKGAGVDGGLSYRVGTTKRVMLCPVASVQYLKSPDFDDGEDGIFETSATGGAAGLAIGGVISSSSSVSFIPFGALRAAGRRGAAVLVAATTALGGCARPVPGDTVVARVDSLMAPLVDAHEFSGAVVLARAERVVYARGFGMANHAAALAFTPDVPSDGASLAKPFTAAGIQLLVHEGRLALDAPVRRYLPHYPHPATTVRHLLSHSNALPADYAYFDAYFAPDQPRTTAAMLAVVARHAPQPSLVPGTRFEYSSMGYDVAAELIERVSGQSYEDFLAARFFSPLNMRATFVRPARFADWRGTRTLGYRWRNDAWVPFDVFDMEAFRGGSNIYFSARDLSRWASAHAEGTALPAAVLAAGQAWSTVNGTRTALTGLNWYCDAARERCYYTGDLNAFFSFVYWDTKRKESVVFVSNSALPMWRRARLARDLVGVLAGAAPLTDSTLAFVSYDTATQAAAAGRYAADGIDTITITTDAQRMQARLGTGLAYDVFSVGSGVYYVPGLDLWLGFSGTPRPTALHVRSVFRDVVARNLF